MNYELNGEELIYKQLIRLTISPWLFNLIELGLQAWILTVLLWDNCCRRQINSFGCNIWKLYFQNTHAYLLKIIENNVRCICTIPAKTYINGKVAAFLLQIILNLIILLINFFVVYELKVFKKINQHYLISLFNLSIICFLE